MWFYTMAERCRFEYYLRRVVHTTKVRGGVTTNVRTRQFAAPMDAWHFPKYPGRTVILPPTSNAVHALRAFIAANQPALCEPDCWLGTWINPTTRFCYLDITTYCVELEEARRIALELSAREGRAIVALYNAKRNQMVYL